MIRVPVPLGERRYDVVVGSGAVGELDGLLPSSARRAVIVTQAGVPALPPLAIDAEVLTIPAGEGAKCLATVETLCRGFTRAGLSRADVVIAVGGGVVTDTAGFAAASYHRGVPVVHVATTLLAQVDAAIGGKTGVNLPEGKNLVGAFWQPVGVICDTDHLATLPPAELRCGFGEVAKYQFLGGDGIDALPIDEQVARCVAIKAEVVASDEREGGRRAILNYGHTLAHAIETAGAYGLRHGEAVAVGLVYAAEVARRLGRIDQARVDEHRRVVARYDLPATSPAIPRDELLVLFGRDKKAIAGITMVLDGPVGVEVVADVPTDVLLASFDAVCAA